MKRRSLLSLWLCLPLVLFAIPGDAQTTPFDLELGYRWLEVDGNEDMYRTQINEEQGFLLRSFTLRSIDFNEATDWIDYFRIDASDLGSGPAGSFRLETGKGRLYNLRLQYRQTDMYSALPGFANPLLDQGIIPGQHTIDRDRTMFDLDLEILPGRAITPFVGYTWFENDGPGRTTYQLGQDEFQLFSDLDEKETEFRAGVAFRFDRIHGQVTQGWRNFDGTESLRLIPGAGSGNNPGPVVDRPIQAEQITRTSNIDVDTPFTNLYVTGEINDRIRLIADFASFEAEAEGTESETAAGAFASFALRRFFDGLEQSIVSDAENESWRGGLRAEVVLFDGVDVLAGFQRRNRKLQGTALITSLYLDSITFGGADPRDLQQILDAESSLERDEEILNVGVRARALGPFAAWAYYSKSDQEVTVAPDLSEIVVPGSQGGTFDRSIDTLELGGSYSMAGFLVTASWRTDDADEAVLRTDFLDRDRIRLRAGWSSPGDFLRLGVTAERTDQSNDRAAIDYDAETRQLTGDFEVAVIDSLHVRGSYSQFRADSTILFRRPENFAIETSMHREEGDGWEGGVTYFRAPLFVEAAFGRFDNEGTNPFQIDRIRSRVLYDITESYGLTGEWTRDEYDEPAAGLGNYEADRFGLYVRWRP